MLARAANQRAQDLGKPRVKFYVSQHESLDKEWALIAEADRLSHEALTDAMKRAQQLEQDHVKATPGHSLKRLLTPTTGTVQQLAIHTEGGVVQVAQPLMQLVPTEYSTEVKLAERRVIKYFLSPVLETTSEGLRER